MFSSSTAGRKRPRGAFISQQVTHKRKVTSVQRCLLSRLPYADRGARLMGSFFLAILLHCVTAAAHGAGVMCKHYEIRASRGLSATAGMRE